MHRFSNPNLASPTIEGVIFKRYDSVSPARNETRSRIYNSFQGEEGKHGTDALRTSFRSRKSSPSKENVRSKKAEASPTRNNYRNKRMEPSPVRDNYMSKRFDVSPARDGYRYREKDPSSLRYSFKSKRMEPSPTRDIFRSKRGEPSPTRDSYRSKRTEPSPTRDNYRSKRTEPSPTRDSYRSKRTEPSPTRDSYRSKRTEPSPTRDSYRSTYRSRKEPSPTRDGFRRFDSSSDRDNVRFERHKPSPSGGRYGPDTDDVMADYGKPYTNDNKRSLTYETSPTRIAFRSQGSELSPSGDRYNCRTGEEGMCRYTSYTSPSPRLGRSSLGYVPVSPRLRKSLKTAQEPSEYHNDRDYLTKVREILLGEPLKGNVQYPTELLPHLYIGNQTNAESLKILRKLGITHVLNMAGYKGPKQHNIGNPYVEVGIEYLEIKAEDNDLYNIAQHFNEAFAFLAKVKRNHGTCLLHCALGINRSGATCVAYLITHCNWPLLKAVAYIKKKRGVVLSNHGFQRQLIQFAREQGLLDPIPPRVILTDVPGDEKFIKSLHRAKYGHWNEALEDLKSHPKEYRDKISLESGPDSALMYRYLRFMNRDKV